MAQSSMSNTALKFAWWTPPYAIGWNLNRDSTVTAVWSTWWVCREMVTCSPQDDPDTPPFARTTPASRSKSTILSLVPTRPASRAEKTAGGGWGYVRVAVLPTAHQAIGASLAGGVAERRGR